MRSPPIPNQLCASALDKPLARSQTACRQPSSWPVGTLDFSEGYPRLRFLPLRDQEAAPIELNDPEPGEHP